MSLSDFFTASSPHAGLALTGGSHSIPADTLLGADSQFLGLTLVTGGDHLLVQGTIGTMEITFTTFTTFPEKSLIAEPFRALGALRQVDAAEGIPLVVDHESEPLAKVARRPPIPGIRG